MDGVSREVELINVVPEAEAFNVSKYESMSNLMDRFKNIFTDSSARNFLGDVRENREILSESLKHDQYVLPTLQIIRTIQRAGNNDRLHEQMYEFRKLGHELLADNLLGIDQAVQRLNDPSCLQLAMKLVANRFTERIYFKEDFPSEGIGFLIRHFEEGLRINGNFVDLEAQGRTSFPINYQYLACCLFESMDVSQQDKAIQMLKHAVESPDIKLSALSIISGLIGDDKTPSKVQTEIRTGLIDPMMEKFGLDYDKLLKSWSMIGNGRSDTYFYTRVNLNEIFSLEESHPGICKVLMNEFGISNFNRYPKELLIDMYEQRDNSNIPYGLMLYPKADHNGAFYPIKGLIGEFYQQLKGLGYGMRIYETGSKNEIARAFISSKKRYGLDNKPAFVILAGHGNPNSIVFGEIQNGGIVIDKKNARSIISQADFEGKGVKRIGEFIADNANIVLISCSTGVVGGIAQKISDTYSGVVVTAPEVDTNLSGLEVTRDDQGALKFTVSYHSGDTKFFTDGKNIQS